MSNVLRVRWTIASQRTPQPWLNCNRCGGPRAFECSGKARVNAQGKRLDAWLVYNCSTCRNSWNRPIFERRHVRELAPALLEALLSNDPEHIRCFAFDVEELRRKTDLVVEHPELHIRKEVLEAPASTPDTLEVQLIATFGANPRLDRLLAAELVVSRRRIGELAACGFLNVLSGNNRMLRRPIRDQTTVRIDVTRLGGEIDLEAAAGRI